MKKLKIIEVKHRQRPYWVLYGKENLGQFSTKELANDFAKIYLVPPYTMQANVWYK